MRLAWEPEAIRHMWDSHQVTPEQAEDALDDPYVLAYRPDPSSRSGRSDRYIGQCSTLNILVVIVVNHAGSQYGANGWSPIPEMRRSIGTTAGGWKMSDATPALPPELLREAFDLENDLPEVRTSEVSSPNFTKSEVAHVRLSAADLQRTQEAAQESGRSVSDVIRAALRQYLHASEIDHEVRELVVALHEHGLRIARS